ncbi:MAG: hypothetical protein IPH37_06015 [Burkholderiales bacterium]|nr:hypothetical protein [Burkholderiales bacterium]
MKTLKLMPNQAVALMKRAGVAIFFIATMVFAPTAFAGEGHDHAAGLPRWPLAPDHPSQQPL